MHSEAKYSSDSLEVAALATSRSGSCTTARLLDPSEAVTQRKSHSDTSWQQRRCCSNTKLVQKKFTPLLDELIAGLDLELAEMKLDSPQSVSSSSNRDEISSSSSSSDYSEALRQNQDLLALSLKSRSIELEVDSHSSSASEKSRPSNLKWLDTHRDKEEHALKTSPTVQHDQY